MAETQTPVAPQPTTTPTRSSSLIKPTPAIHGLVVKIIKWRNGAPGAEKITAKEWRTYSKHLITISKSKDPSETKATLRQTYDAIKTNSGFETN